MVFHDVVCKRIHAVRLARFLVDAGVITGPICDCFCALAQLVASGIGLAQHIRVSFNSSCVIAGKGGFEASSECFNIVSIDFWRMLFVNFYSVMNLFRSKWDKLLTKRYIRLDIGNILRALPCLDLRISWIKVIAIGIFIQCASFLHLVELRYPCPLHIVCRHPPYCFAEFTLWIIVFIVKPASTGSQIAVGIHASTMPKLKIFDGVGVSDSTVDLATKAFAYTWYLRANITHSRKGLFKQGWDEEYWSDTDNNCGQCKEEIFLTATSWEQ